MNDQDPQGAGTVDAKAPASKNRSRRRRFQLVIQLRATVRHPFNPRKRKKYRDKLIDHTPYNTSVSSDLEAAWYLIRHKDVAAAKADPRKHYQRYGKAEGRSWGLPKETALEEQKRRYLKLNPDVAAKGLDAVQHFIQSGAAEGRDWPFLDHSAEEQAANLLPSLELLSFTIDPALAAVPALNVLVPGLALKHLTGGPNTAINLACRLAATGIKVRLVSTNAVPDEDQSAFWTHAALLSGTDARSHGVELVDASARERPMSLGVNDLFMATAWWTAQAVKYAIRHTRHKRFFYIIQDYEPLLHAASTAQALASETYCLDHVPIINSQLLYDHLVKHKVGCFADPDFASRALVFEPAIDPTLFHPAEAVAAANGKKRLLMYARPTKGERNLFELGVAALRVLIARGEFDFTQWDFHGMGEDFAPVWLGPHIQLTALPWKGLQGYAQFMRESDVLLSLMHSPHPSYPPLEMAACGRPVVTTTFGSKTAARLAEISPNIIGVDPTLEGIADGLAEAFRRDGTRDKIKMPQTWSESFARIIPGLHDTAFALLGAPVRTAAFGNASGSPSIFPGFGTWPSDGYETYRQTMLAERAALYASPAPQLLSFITPVWNTASRFLFELAETVLGQDSGCEFEWLILDNGSDSAETRQALAAIADHPAVHLSRVEQNIGIVPALRYLLEHAHNRYIVPLDSDDLITPDCVRVMTSALQKAGFPAIAYSDEDKQLQGHQRDPYNKPDWDPVLFTHSCYIAHLCAIDREVALQLGCYTNREAEGSSDWDSFTRFLVAGHTPIHIPELIYTWRMHPQSTSLDISSKSYIHDSQKSVLEMFLRGRRADSHYSVEFSPLFDGTPDWRFVRDPGKPKSITTLLFGPGANRSSFGPGFEGHRVEKVESADLSVLLDHARQASADGRYVHLLAPEVTIEDPNWSSEALAMFELFPDTAIVGGRIVKDGVIVAADDYFGFNGACNSPNLGRTAKDPGYFAQLLKPHSVSAVPVQHCVLDASFLAEVLPSLIQAGVTNGALSMWLAAAARRRQKRCVYTPFFAASTRKTFSAPSSVEVAAFTLAYGNLIPDRALMSPRLGLTPQTAYEPTSRETRLAQEAAARVPPPLSYPERHAAELTARRATAAMPNTLQADISILTTIYINTDAALFRDTAASLFAQTLPFREWIVLAHGPISEALEKVLEEISADPRVRALRRDKNLGIIGGMRLCLEEASGRFCLPMDADDLLTVDALQVVMNSFSETKDTYFAFSDEDILSGGSLQSPIKRTAFDPILNNADSTIWHLCAFARQRALELGVYSDKGAEFCHDWDTALRFSRAGETMLHIPHVLYHWRHHAKSTSNSGTVNDGSQASVKYVLSEIKKNQKCPDLYKIEPYPINRGVEQLSLKRRNSAPLPLCLIYMVRGSGSHSVPDKVLAVLPIGETRILHLVSGDMFDREDLARIVREVTSDYLVLLDERLYPSNDNGPWDAMQLFEMHSDVAAVAGRIIDTRDQVAACCETLSGRALTSEWIGKPRTYPGEQALALKPQTAIGIVEGYSYCSKQTLTLALERCTASVTLTELCAGIAETSKARGMRLAYSPLCEAQRTK